MNDYFLVDQYSAAIGMLEGICITHPELKELIQTATQYIDSRINVIYDEIKWYEKNAIGINEILEASYDPDEKVFKSISIEDLDISEESIADFINEMEGIGE